MDGTPIFAAVFPVFTLLNAYCLGKVFGRYVPNRGSFENQNIVIGFFIYVAVVFAASFLFVFIPTPYDAYLYLLYAVHGLLAIFYAIHWRSVFSVAVLTPYAYFGFVVLAAIAYGAMFLSFRGGDIPFIPATDGSTTAGDAVNRFQTWDIFIRSWFYLTGATDRVGAEYSIRAVQAILVAGIVATVVQDVRGLWRKVAVACLWLAVMTAGFFALSTSVANVWLVIGFAYAVVLANRLKDEFAHRADGLLLCLVVGAAYTLERDFSYLAVVLLAGSILGMARSGHWSVGPHFVRSLLCLALLTSLHIYPFNTAAAAVLFFVTAAATLVYARLALTGRQRRIVALGKWMCLRHRYVFTSCLFTILGAFLLYFLIAGFAVADYTVVSLSRLLSLDGSDAAWWAAFGALYSVFWLAAAYLCLRRSKGRVSAITYGSVLFGNPLVLFAVASFQIDLSVHLGAFVVFALPFGWLHGQAVATHGATKRAFLSSLFLAGTLAGVGYGTLGDGSLARPASEIVVANGLPDLITTKEKPRSFVGGGVPREKKHVQDS